MVRSADTALVPQLQLSDVVSGDYFRALYTGTGPGVVSTGTRPP